MVSIEPTATAPADLWRQLRPDWLVVESPIEGPIEGPIESLISNLVESRLRQLAQYSKNQHPSVMASRPLLLIAHDDPTAFLASFWAALLSGWNIALTNPHWGQQEWQSVSQLLQPDLIWPAAFSSLFSFPAAPVSSSAAAAAIFIPTGGSSGNIKFTHHTWHSLTVAALGFCRHFQPNGGPVNAYCVLPLYHVSGLMQAIRALVSGGQLFLSPFKSLLSASDLTSSPPSSTYLSLVPTQLERLLRHDRAAWLSRFRAVILGGAPPWPSLVNRAIAQQILLYLSYGMTETGAMVTASRVDPSAALSPGRLSSMHENTSAFSSGQVLPHAAMHVEQDGKHLPFGEVGQIVVQSDAIALGYHHFPSSAFAPSTFYTDDLGYLDATGALYVTGRASRKIISGGENIFPTEVEAALRSTGLVNDVVVLGLPHPEWGEVVAAVYVPSSDAISAESLKRSLSDSAAPIALDQTAPNQTTQPVRQRIQPSQLAQLSRYKHPKQWIAVNHLPRNAQGKLNQAALLAQISANTANSL